VSGVAFVRFPRNLINGKRRVERKIRAQDHTLMRA
jgi:hypothetical protein